MAGTVGLAMMAAIRAAETAAQRAPTPAIAVSGYTTQEDQMRALVAGYQAHVAKPINITVLLATICNLVGRGGNTCEGAA
jgi:CheY-like chemotaxis protein